VRYQVLQRIGGEREVNRAFCFNHLLLDAVDAIQYRLVALAQATAISKSQAPGLLSRAGGRARRLRIRPAG
jgi:hypothetical protein